MMNMSDMMQQCTDMMNSMMGNGSMTGSGMMDSNPMSWLLPLALVALLVWVLSLVILGGLGVWAYRRLRTH